MATKPSEATIQRLREVLSQIKKKHHISTQKEILIRTGYGSMTYISDMIAGKIPVSTKFAMKLLEVFRVNPDYLLSGTGMLWMDDAQFEQSEKNPPMQQAGRDLQNGNNNNNTEVISKLTEQIEGLNKTIAEMNSTIADMSTTMSKQNDIIANLSSKNVELVQLLTDKLK